MKFFLKLTLISCVLFIMAFAITVFATRYHYSTLLNVELKNVKKDLAKQLPSTDLTNHEHIQAIKDNLKLSKLSIDDKSTANGIHLTPSTQANNITEFLLGDFLKEQQLQINAMIVRFKIDTTSIFKQVNQVLLAELLLFIITYILHLILVFLLVKKLQSILIAEINNDKIGNTGFDLVSTKLSERKNGLYVEIKQQQQQIDDLLKQMAFDQLTGLYNRKSFRIGMHELLGIEVKDSSALFIIRATALDDINQHNGHQLGDVYLQEVAAAIRLSLKAFKGLKLYRICGGDFAVLAEDITLKTAQELATEIHNQFDSYQDLHELNCVGHIGFTLFKGDEQPDHIITRADLALAKAQTKGANAWAKQMENDNKIEGEHHWKNIIEQIIETQQVEIFEQKISGVSAGMISYRELYSHFYNSDGTSLSSSTVFTMAERLDLSSELEKMILLAMFEQIQPKNGIRINWGITISPTSIQNPDFVKWLCTELKKRPEIASTLIFEVDEAVLDRNIVASQRLFATFKQLHCRSCIKKFGRGIASFKLFKSLKPDMVKVDSDLITKIHTDRANQQFVRMLVDVAHRMDSRVIAEGVEEYGQKQVLQAMNFDALQGYFISKPVGILSELDDA